MWGTWNNLEFSHFHQSNASDKLGPWRHLSLYLVHFWRKTREGYLCTSIRLLSSEFEVPLKRDLWAACMSPSFQKHSISTSLSKPHDDSKSVKTLLKNSNNIVRVVELDTACSRDYIQAYTQLECITLLFGWKSIPLWNNRKRTTLSTAANDI